MRGFGVNNDLKKRRKQWFKEMQTKGLLKSSAIQKDLVLSALQVIETAAGKVIFKSVCRGSIDAGLTPQQQLKRVAASMQAVDSNIKIVSTLLKVEPEDYDFDREDFDSEKFEQTREQNMELIRSAAKYNKNTSLEMSDPHDLGTQLSTQNISTWKSSQFTSTMAYILAQSLDICEDLISATKPKLDETGLKVLAELEKKFGNRFELGEKLADNLASGKINLNHIALMANDVNRQVESRKVLPLKR